jgi:DNA-directed RNA polymerase subunit RPC12/RpoP
MNEHKNNCPKCHREIRNEDFPFGLIYCPYCGEKMGNSEALDPIPFCPYCGQRLLAEAVYCPQCGKKLVHEPTKPIPSQEIICEIAPGSSAKPLISSDKQAEPARIIPHQVDAEPTEPGAKPYFASGKSKLGQSSWPRIKSFFNNIITSIKDLFSGQNKVKHLYQHWTHYDALPTDAIPSDETLLRISKESGADPYRLLRLTLTLVGLVCMVMLFILIGIWMRSCA